MKLTQNGKRIHTLRDQTFDGYHRHLRHVEQFTSAELAVIKRAQRDVSVRDLAGQLIWSKARELRQAFRRVHGRANKKAAQWH